MLTAVIDAQQCVGCTRCIDVCPVDAIVGSHKFLHTVLLDECIGCKLCVAPCPVDCISVLPLQECLPEGEHVDKLQRAQRAKMRHGVRQQRLMSEAQRQLVVRAEGEDRAAEIKREIAAAVARAKARVAVEVCDA